MTRSDDRVKDLVESRLPAISRRRRALHLCPRGHKHIARPSYGQKNWENVGLLYEICLGGNDACNKALHAEQMSEGSMSDLFDKLVGLEPPPYGKQLLHAQAILMQAELRERIEAHTTAGQLPVLPRRRASSFSAVTPRRERTQASVPVTTSGRVGSGSVGRPTNPTCEVVVYIYTDNAQEPLEITAQGTPRDNVVEFVFNQPNILNVLSIDPAARTKTRSYLSWNGTIQEWATFPKAHQPQVLAPGQRLLYRESYVHDMPRLNEIKYTLMPPGLPGSSRIPSLLAHSGTVNTTASPSPVSSPSRPSTKTVKRAGDDMAERAPKRRKMKTKSDVIDLTMADDDLREVKPLRHARHIARGDNNDVIVISDSE
ncbi:hypothetical protein TRAPUB_9707 [Trametes pubescens]|uniref:Uncharacterized protein n=1 Tax=Trametes pubescens TaxID=154538 RepID=A0A1M2W1W7_TRAPU|nr:hypothetical protein TRAPUB_9707 [Trametes pubescens]